MKSRRSIGRGLKSAYRRMTKQRAITRRTTRRTVKYLRRIAL